MQRLMKSIVLMAVLSATLSGCASSTNSNSPATNSNVSAARTTPTPLKSDAGVALSTPSSSSEERVKATDAYVADLEAKLPTLTRKEKVLKPEQLKGSDGGEIWRSSTLTMMVKLSNG